MKYLYKNSLIRAEGHWAGGAVIMGHIPYKVEFFYALTNLLDLTTIAKNRVISISSNSILIAMVK